MSIIHRTIALYDRGTDVLLKADFLPLLVARLSVGWVMAEAGYGKLTNLQQTIANFSELGIPLPEIQAPMVATCEFMFGGLLMLGLFTRIASIPLMVIMTVAIVTVLAKDLNDATGLFSLSEYLFIVLLLVLLVRGGGFLSVDRFLVWRRSNCGHQCAATPEAKPVT